MNDKQLERMLQKLVRYEKTLEPYVFSEIAEVEVRRYETLEQYHCIPEDESLFRSTKKGDIWGGEGVYCWFKGKVEIPREHKGRDIYIKPTVGGYEAMLWVNGIPSGTFATKIVQTGHGNHYCDLLIKGGDMQGESVEFAVEFYAGHYIIGTQPFETIQETDFCHTYNGMSLCIKNQDIADFIFDLRTLNQMVEKLDPLSFRRADIINCLTEVHKAVYYAVEDSVEEVWRRALIKARYIMEPVLAAKNSQSAPVAGIVGHSHMDTAWLWHIPETIKKCARTYSNEISLMDQYPEYRFVQSSSYHTEMIRLHYPGLFERLREKVEEGRYELNGAVWVECDCNITSGESMIRQFLWGQKYTQKYFNKTSNCFWLPDTFGYSAAIPQIMKGCRVDYFLTTKLSWNDTNKFPYETFYWRGIDGTEVFTHFNLTHCWPDPRTLLENVDGRGSDNYLKNKSVAKSRLIAYGYGDGGGGPQFEMIEMAKRLRDLEGCPKAEHVSVGEFMTGLEGEAVNPPVYSGELYLELHRGTLTNQHTIKRNNRKAEAALHDLEFLTVLNAVSEGTEARDEDIRPLMETLLVNQFHDILPGTCISAAHDNCYREMGELLDKAASLIDKLVKTSVDTLVDNSVKNSVKTSEAADSDRALADAVTVINTLGFERNDVIYLHGFQNRFVKDKAIISQSVRNIRGEDQLCLANVILPSLGGKVIEFEEPPTGSASAGFDAYTQGQPGLGRQSVRTDFKLSAFKLDGNMLTTPFAKVTFAEDGTISSFIDTRVNRELRGNGNPLNTLLIAEDVPSGWDSWDIDADCQMKFEADARLIQREIISDGRVQLRIRSTYKLTDKSTLKQDMIFFSTTPRVDFETVIDWNDKHRFLKVDFDTTIMSNTARHEIQFGHCQKPTTRNNSYEQAMFEVVNHKFTDISETRFGIAILNDCKYGISVEGSDIRLSLHKGGTRPDPRGDSGVHECTYSFLPHVGGFSAENVIIPAYCLNYKPLMKSGRADYSSFATVDCTNIIIETIKPCEENDKAYIMRFYEAEGTYTNAAVTLNHEPKSVELANMLEERVGELSSKSRICLTFRPFEIKTVKVGY